MATAAALMRRTPSVMQPQLFTFEDHFDFEAVIGRSPHSEVYRARHKISGELFAVKRSMRRFRSRADRERYAQALGFYCLLEQEYTCPELRRRGLTTHSEPPPTVPFSVRQHHMTSDACKDCLEASRGSAVPTACIMPSTYSAHIVVQVPA